MQQIGEWRFLPMIDRGDIQQAIDRCSNIWASTAGLVIVYKADSLTGKIRGSKEWLYRLMYEQSHRDYLRSGYSHHRSPVMGC